MHAAFALPHDAEAIITDSWEGRADITAKTQGPVRAAVDGILAQLDSGALRVAEKTASGWITHAWIKKAVLLSFRLNPNRMIAGGPDQSHFWDKVGIKTAGWREQDHADSAYRSVPGSIVRQGAFVAPNVVLMPSFINIGAYVDESTMIDTWSTVGSCAQIGKHCHISGGVGIGGVLEPVQANPVIIEDNVFIGARSEVAEGVIVEQGAVISMGVFLGASTKIVDRATGAVHMGRVPAYSVVVPGMLPGKDGGPGLSCAVIVKTVDEKTRSKTGINDLLRD